MKKLLLLLLTMCTALCAKASDLDFEVEVNGRIIVNGSVLIDGTLVK